MKIYDYNGKKNIAAIVCVKRGLFSGCGKRI